MLVRHSITGTSRGRDVASHPRVCDIVPFVGAFWLFLGWLNFLQGIFPHDQTWEKKKNDTP